MKMLSEIEKRALERYSQERKMGKLSIVFNIFINNFYEFIAQKSPVHSIRVKFHRKRGIQIGDDTYIGRDIIFDRVYPHLIKIGNHSCIGERSIISTHQGFPMNSKLKELYPIKVEPVTILDDVMIYPCVKILPGVIIYNYSLIGIGSIVTRSIPPMFLAAGAPAKLKKDLSEELKKIIDIDVFNKLMDIRKKHFNM